MSSRATSGPVPAGAQSPDQPDSGLLKGALATVGYASFLPLLICFIPMLGIAIGYQRLNAWQPSAGATYSWVGSSHGDHIEEELAEPEAS